MCNSIFLVLLMTIRSNPKHICSAQLSKCNALLNHKATPEIYWCNLQFLDLKTKQHCLFVVFWDWTCYRNHVVKSICLCVVFKVVTPNMGWFHAWFFKTVTPNMGWFHAWVWVCKEATTSKAICPIPVKQDINDNMGYTMFKYTWKCQGKTITYGST